MSENGHKAARKAVVLIATIVDFEIGAVTARPSKP
jgi:hypothetical protein